MPFCGIFLGINTMEIEIYSILIWISAIVIISLDLVIVLGSKNLSSRIFAVFTFVAALWATSFSLHMAILNTDMAVFFVNIDLELGILISIGFYYFSLIYPDDHLPKNNSRLIFCMTFIALLFYVFLFHTNFLIFGAYRIDGPTHWAWNHSQILWIYSIVFFVLWSLGLRNIYKRLRHSKDRVEKSNLIYMFVALLIGVTPPFLLDIILPFSNFSDYYQFGWLGPITSTFWIFIIAHSIIKYRQMNIKVVAAEVLAISLAVIFFINIFIAYSIGTVGRVVIFAVFVLLGMFLIKGVLRESKQKEQLGKLNLQMKDLNENLQKKVDDQTKEIKKAYEVEKRARIELQKLDQNKNDFIIITQHHLRTPLTQIRWYADSILKGLYGNVSFEISEAVSRIGIASEKLTKTLNSFIDITQLKIGVKVLNRSPINVKNIIGMLISEFSNDIRAKKISISFSEDIKNWPLILADHNQIKDVCSILIDNAIKYNNEGGSINIYANQNDKMLSIYIENSGIGLDTDDRERILKQSFFRSKDAKKLNPLGMGVGLLVAKTIVEAHKGAISIQSNPGACSVRVIIQLPLAVVD
jgi:signal transduction histidine kinase